MSPQGRALEYALKTIKEWEYLPYVYRVILYGSYARGDAGSRSDVDLYVECSREIPPNELRVLRSEIIPCIPETAEVDIHFGFDELDNYDDLYHRNIRKDGLVVWEATEDILRLQKASISI